MTIYEKLSAIQQKIKAPKNLYNSFGKYKYRNAESILEAFKPFEAMYNVALILTDEVVQIGDRYYIEAKARLYDLEAEAIAMESRAYAREDEAQKGKDGSQITGTASSYARKYALNGLFLLDDTKDADTDENRIGAENRASERVIKKAEEEAAQENGLRVTDAMITTLKQELRRVGKTDTELLDFLKVATFREIPVEQYKRVMDDMKRAPSVDKYDTVVSQDELEPEPLPEGSPYPLRR